MNRFLVPVHQRPASNAASLARRVQVLESRADSALPAQSGVVDPSYSSGDPMVTVGTDTALSGPYQRLSGYTPAAGDTVALLWLGGTWIVLGKLS